MVCSIASIDSGDGFTPGIAGFSETAMRRRCGSRQAPPVSERSCSDLEFGAALIASSKMATSRTLRPIPPRTVHPYQWSSSGASGHPAALGLEPE